MIVIYAFYADIFFLRNFMTDAIVLFVVAALRKENGKFRSLRILGASAVGSALSLILLFAGKSYLLFLCFTYMAVFPLTVWISFGFGRLRRFAGTCVLTIVTAVFLGGILEAAEQNFGLGRLWLPGAVLAGMLMVAALRYLFWTVRKRKDLHPVRLLHNGRAFSGMALYDSGNFLRDPYEKRPVQILSEKVLRALTEGDGQLPRQIPYRALGTKNGLLEIYVLERMILGSGKDTAEFENITVGKAPAELLDGKDYQMILNQNLWEMRGMEYGNKDRTHHTEAVSPAEKRGE